MVQTSHPQVTGFLEEIPKSLDKIYQQILRMSYTSSTLNKKPMNSWFQVTMLAIAVPLAWQLRFHVNREKKTWVC